MAWASITEELLAAIGLTRVQRGHRLMSGREQERLRKTTNWILDNLDFYLQSRALEEGFRKGFAIAVADYYRDEWYELSTQVDYLHLLRDLVLEKRQPDPNTLRAVLQYFDLLIMTTVEVCRPGEEPFTWPLLVLVGFGDLARKKLVGPIKGLLPSTPFDLWIADEKEEAIAAAHEEFKEMQHVKVLSSSKLAQEFRKSLAARKIAYIATPSRTHYSVAKTYFELGAHIIAIEKPLCLTASDVEAFIRLSEEAKKKDANLVVVDHYARKRAAIIVEQVKKHAAQFSKAFDQAERMVFRMIEKAPVDLRRGAAQEGVIFDMLPHLFPFISAFLTTDFTKLEVVQVEAWRYEGFKIESETFARVVLKASLGWFKKITIEAHVGKGVGVAEDLKEVELTGPDLKVHVGLLDGKVWARQGTIKLDIDDASTRDLGYGRVIGNLLSSPTLKLQGIDTGIEVVRLLLEIQKRKKDKGTYPLAGRPAGIEI